MLGANAAAIYGLIATAKLNGLNPKHTCARCSHASPIIPSTASKNYSRGISLQTVLQTQVTQPNQDCLLVNTFSGSYFGSGSSV
jgi:hypothetical protein